MGSGKSTFGKALAEEMGYGFMDLDLETEKLGKATISQIFNEKGEDAFRVLEQQALKATESLENTVIATGGGTPCFFDNMEWMNAQGLTVYLKLFEGELKNRIIRDMDNRPLLQNVDIVNLDDFIYTKLRERAYYYHLAKIVIDPLVLEAKDLAGLLKKNYL